MARAKIVILDKTVLDDNSFDLRFCLWADVNVLRRQFYANPAATSAYLDISETDLADLRAGVFTERVQTRHFAAGTTIGQVGTTLEGLFATYQAKVDSAKNWEVYGTMWDGTTWTTGGR